MAEGVVWGHQFPNTEAHMPDQNTQRLVNIGDVLTADQIVQLPIGAVVTDKDGDTVQRIDANRWRRSDGHTISRAPLDYFANLHKPYTLTVIPKGVFAVNQPDLFQRARIALRDRLGTEPSDDLVEGTQRLMQSGKVDAEEAAHLVAGAQSPFTAPAPIADTFVLVVVHGSDAASRLVVSADTTAGLARLRAHAALDALLDQHGISR